MKYQKFVEFFVEENEYICGNRFIELSNMQDILFCKTDYISEYFNKETKIFITHNSDYEINQQVISVGPKTSFWFCQNKNVNNTRFISIPIGLENFEPIFDHRSHFGKYSSLPENGFIKKEYINELTFENFEHNKLVYLNINPATYPSERNFVLSLFKEKKWVTHKANLSWREYYNDIAQHKFVISPRGNGIDCHRTWESLYLRTIPIVLKSLHMNEFSDLPILLIDSWEQITESFLLTEYDKMINRKYNFDKLKMSYWEKIINGT